MSTGVSDVKHEEQDGRKHVAQHGSTHKLTLAGIPKSSWLPALLFMPLMLANGVLAPFTEPASVELDGGLSPSPLAMFAFQAEYEHIEGDDGRGKGAMVGEGKKREVLNLD
jgi:hypothetical protein